MKAVIACLVELEEFVELFVLLLLIEWTKNVGSKLPVKLYNGIILNQIGKKL